MPISNHVRPPLARIALAAVGIAAFFAGAEDPRTRAILDAQER